MPSRSNRGFSLVEVLIAAGILAAAITFVLRSFTASLNSSRFSQNITSACLFAENKLWEIEQRYKDGYELPVAGTEIFMGRKFDWNYEVANTSVDRLDTLRFSASWQEGVREKPYVIELYTYLEPKK